jgi:hypothetical protein
MQFLLEVFGSRSFETQNSELSAAAISLTVVFGH